MAVVATGLTLAGLKSTFFQRFGEVNQQTYWNQLATIIQSQKGSETYAFLGSVPPMREWGTGRLARGLYAESYSVENLKYEITLEVDRTELEDDQTGQIRIRTMEMADRAATHKDSLIGALLANGATAGYTAYDGLTFFNANHTSGKSGTQSNIVTATGTTDPDAPTTAEFRAALATAITRLLSFKDDQGEPLSIAPTGLVVVVPPAMILTAMESLNATLIGSTSNVLEGVAKVIAFTHLTATDKFYLMKTDMAVRPFIFQDRTPLEFTALEQNSDEGFRRDKFLYGVRARYRVLFGRWEYCVLVDFDA